VSYSISQVTSDLASILHGTSTSQINNINGLFNRAARQLLLDIDPQETKRITQTTTPIYNQVYDYAVPTDLKGNKIIDIFPQVNRTSRDLFLQDYNQSFDIAKAWTGQDQFTIILNTGVKTMHVAAPTLTVPVQITAASTTTGWSVGGGASTLTADSTNFIVGGASLKFNLDAGQSTGYLENSTLTSVDLSDYLNQATNFLYTYLPTGSSVTSVNFRFGSSSSAYYTLSATVNQDNVAFINGWNLLSYIWSSMTTVGSPDSTAITYIRVTWTYDSTLQTAVRLNDVFSALGTILNVEYYSKYLFRNSSGTWIETVTATDGSDLVNLDTESYNIYLNQVAALAAQQLQGADAQSFDYPFFIKAYQDGVKRYKSMYKSEVQIPQSTYYQQPNPSYNRWTGRGRWGY
jgi:hypothetical protein